MPSGARGAPWRVTRPLRTRLLAPSTKGSAMDIRTLQRPLKEAYREDPERSQITLVASGAALRTSGIRVATAR